jgi:hypothetical protein
MGAVLRPLALDGIWIHQELDFRAHRQHVPPKHDSSNIFRRESLQQWHIRFGNHECHAPHSDGRDMLSVLLLHPDGMSAQQICNEIEIGLGAPGTAAMPSSIARLSVGVSKQLAELGKRANSSRKWN